MSARVRMRMCPQNMAAYNGRCKKRGFFSRSVTSLLRQRETERDSYRIEKLGCMIIRAIVLQPSIEFVEVWKKESKRSICIGLDRRIYVNKYQTCYFVEGKGGKPRELYTLPTTGPLAMNIRSMILYHCHIRQPPSTLEEERTCLLIQTADGYVKVLDASTGEILRSIFVSSLISFSSLDWADYYHTVQLKSTIFDHSRRRQRRREGGGGGRGGGGGGGQDARGGGSGSDPHSQSLLVIVVFKIHPLELVASISIDKNIFGEDIKDAELSEDVLVVSHKNKIFRFYSFAWILENCTLLGARLGQVVEAENGKTGRVGEPGFGIPVTIKMTERPPLLFEVQSNSDYGVQFGGCPTVYSHNALPTAPYAYHIKTLAGNRPVGTIESDALSIHPDSANFHFDNYQRFIHISGCTYSSYTIKVADGEPVKLEKEYSVDFKKKCQGQDVCDRPIMSSSGRVIKRLKRSDEFDDLVSALLKVELEDEVDLVYAVVTMPAGDDTEALLIFIEDKTGQVLKTIRIPTWLPGEHNYIDYELDCILHVTEHRGCSTCHYYRLTRKTCK